MPDVVDRVRALLQTRIAELISEQQRLNKALQNLGATHSTPRSTPRRNRRRGSKPSRVARGQRRQQLLEAIKDNPGVPGAELARIIGIAPSQVYALIGNARADKLIVKKGKGYAIKA